MIKSKIGKKSKLIGLIKTLSIKYRIAFVTSDLFKFKKYILWKTISKINCDIQSYPNSLNLLNFTSNIRRHDNEKSNSFCFKLFEKEFVKKYPIVLKYITKIGKCTILKSKQGKIIKA